MFHTSHLVAGFWSLKALSLVEWRGLVGVLITEVRRLQPDNTILRDKVEVPQATITSLQTEKQVLRDEVARLKGLPPRPLIRPSDMEKATEPGTGAKGKKCSKQRRGFCRKFLKRTRWSCDLWTGLSCKGAELLRWTRLSCGAQLPLADHMHDLDAGESGRR